MVNEDVLVPHLTNKAWLRPLLVHALSAGDGSGIILALLGGQALEETSVGCLASWPSGTWNKYVERKGLDTRRGELAEPAEPADEVESARSVRGTKLESVVSAIVDAEVSCGGY